MEKNLNLLNVLIYSGAGSCEFSVNQALRTLKKFLKPVYDVKTVDLNTLKCEQVPWDVGCALFVLPGGRDQIYLQEFKTFIPRLRKALNDGKMKYLGICAGAYFAADRIEFEMGRKGYEVSGDRPLKLIDSCAKGTLSNAKFYYADDCGASKDQLNSSLQAVEIVKFDGSPLLVAYNGGCYFEDVDEVNVFARYNENEKAAIILKNNFCLSGVHFEYDPVDCLAIQSATGSKVFSDLIKFENQRQSLVCDILNGLGLRAQIPSAEQQQTDQLEVINIYTNFELEPIKLLLNDKKLIFKKPISGIGSFCQARFHELIPSITLLYAPICTSTQIILLNEPELLGALPNFSVFVADHQVSGKGRAGNFWISSPACLQFTLLLEHPTEHNNRLPLLQFLMAISIAETINSFPINGGKNKNNIHARIKWPNDIYLCKDDNDDVIGKVAGILVNCVSGSKKIKTTNTQVLIGVGINILSDPDLPNITHLNDHLDEDLRKEDVLAELLNRFQCIYMEFISSGKFPFEDYYKNWLHSNKFISATESQPDDRIRIRGIDEFGYLVGLDEKGKLVKFEPDGNSFDMMKNLIKRK